MFIVLSFCSSTHMFPKIFNPWIENSIVPCGKRHTSSVGTAHELSVGIPKKARIVVIVSDCMAEVPWNGGLCFNQI